MQSLAHEFQDMVSFVKIYISEAHALDGWKMYTHVDYNEPRYLHEREKVARKYIKEMQINVPLVMDVMDNKAEQMYSAFPERLYVVDANNKIIYKGAKGPFGYKPDELRQWLLDRQQDSKTTHAKSSL